MKITIKATKIELTPKLKEFIEEQINSLEKFAKRILEEKSREKFLKKKKEKIEARVEIREKERGFYYAECNLILPHKLLRAESLQKNLKSAIHEVKKELKRELKEHKEKFLAKMKRETRKLRRELKVSESIK